MSVKHRTQTEEIKQDEDEHIPNTNNDTKLTLGDTIKT